MSYLKYAGLCSDMVRAALVPELRAKARTREVVYYRESVWKDGAPEKQSATDRLRSPASPRRLVLLARTPAWCSGSLWQGGFPFCAGRTPG